MKRIHVLGRDICGGHADLVILPCSGKMKQVEKPRTQARIEHYGLPTPFDLKEKFGYGRMSPIIPPSKNGDKIKYFSFAASVLNTADVGAIERIGEQIGGITKENEQIRLIEAPFLGCGDGGLDPGVAMFALAKGFLSKSHHDAILQICSDSAISVTLAKAAIDKLLSKEPKENTNQDSLPLSF